jgi:hypothetical protein
MKPRNRKPEPKEDPNDPAHLFHFYRKQSIDPSKSEIERAVARSAMMDCWSRVPWGLAGDVLDMKVKS